MQVFVWFDTIFVKVDHIWRHLVALLTVTSKWIYSIDQIVFNLGSRQTAALSFCLCDLDIFSLLDNSTATAIPSLFKSVDESTISHIFQWPLHQFLSKKPLTRNHYQLFRNNRTLRPCSIFPHPITSRTADSSAVIWCLVRVTHQGKAHLTSWWTSLGIGICKKKLIVYASFC